MLNEDNHAPPSDQPPAFFGVTLPLMLAIAATGIWWRYGQGAIALILIAVSIVVLIAYARWESTRQPIFRGFRRVTRPIQWTVTAILLTVIYYGLLTPIGWCLRLTGGDFRGKKSELKTNWKARTKAPPLERYFETY